MIPEIGQEGQKKIKETSIVLAGLGGLGSISAYYLVASGLGRLRVVDKDEVELSNLNRQIIHWTDDLGRAKTDVAVEKLGRLNPACQIEPLQAEIREDNVFDLIAGCSMIVDGTDNLETRKVLNQASLQNGIPYIFGGVGRLSGMVTTFIPGETACLECLFPFEGFPEEKAGVIGPVPGIVASIQALEAVKLILGMEEGLLTRRLLLVRGEDMTFKEIRAERNPVCEVCSTKLER
jgi:adenylyltransferase/sulfurtransferase